MSVVTEFKEFVLRGNVVDLAVGVVVGAAFSGVVKAFTDDLISPLIGLPGKIDLKGLAYEVNKDTAFKYGDFLTSLISFIITAAVVFFFVVKPLNWLMTRKKTETPVAPDTRECPYCLSKVPLAASRCAFCTSELPAAA